LGILIVEKDNASAELIYEIFIQEIKKFYFASDCIQASIAFREYKPSVVIIDLDTSFFEVIELIQTMRVENPKIKIIAMYSCNKYNIKENFRKYNIDNLANKNSIHETLHNMYLDLIKE
jgi:DNA-binding response OmpR family regulator